MLVFYNHNKSNQIKSNQIKFKVGNVIIDWLIDFIYIRGEPEKAAIVYLAIDLKIILLETLTWKYDDNQLPLRARPLDYVIWVGRF